MAKSIPRKKSRTPLVIIILVIVLAIVFVLLEVTHTTHIFIKSEASGQIPSKSKSVSTKRTQQHSTSNSSTSSVPTSSASSSKISAPSPSSTTALLPPYGSFVSNHTPGVNGSSTKEQSVCSTTAGAKCFIQFTKDGVTKNLDQKIADSSGSIIWDWDVKDAGFTSGSWKITAVASLNGQSVSASDQINLEVGQ